MPTYKSIHTGVQVDTAVTKVLTKVNVDLTYDSDNNVIKSGDVTQTFTQISGYVNDKDICVRLMYDSNIYIPLRVGSTGVFFYNTYAQESRVPAISRISISSSSVVSTTSYNTTGSIKLVYDSTNKVIKRALNDGTQVSITFLEVSSFMNDIDSNVYLGYNNQFYIPTKATTSAIDFDNIYAGTTSSAGSRITLNSNNTVTTSNVSYELQGNKVTSISSSSTNTQYPTAKLLYDVRENLPGDSLELTTSKKLNVQTPVIGYKTGNMSSDTTLYNAVEERKRSTFDRSKFTVVGSPTITDDGIASGFSTGDYVATPSIDFSNANSWVIYTQKFNMSNITTGNNTILYWRNAKQNNDGIAIFVRGNGKTSWGIQSTIGTFLFKRDAGTSIKINTDYQIKMQFTGTRYEFYLSKNNAKFELVDFYESTTKCNLNIDISIGKGLQQAMSYGSIDLKQFSITVDGVEVFNGNKTGIDQIKKDDYTEVGIPTITDDGIASGFTATSYIKKQTTISTANLSTMVIFAKCTWNGTTPSQNACVLGGAAAYGPSVYLNTSKQWELTLMTSDANFKKAAVAGDNYFKFVLENNVWNFYFSTDGITYEYIGQINKTNFTNWTIHIGQNLYASSLVRPYNVGTIDLNAFKIYVDGNLVYQPCLKIPFTYSKTGSLIVDSQYKERVEDAYNQFGHAEFYIVDEVNKAAALPMSDTYGLIGTKVGYTDLGTEVEIEI